jgi:hypothetical protein
VKVEVSRAETWRSCTPGRTGESNSPTRRSLPSAPATKLRPCPRSVVHTVAPGARADGGALATVARPPQAGQRLHPPPSPPRSRRNHLAAARSSASKRSGVCPRVAAAHRQFTAWSVLALSMPRALWSTSTTPEPFRMRTVNSRREMVRIAPSTSSGVVGPDRRPPLFYSTSAEVIWFRDLAIS